MIRSTPLIFSFLILLFSAAPFAFAAEGSESNTPLPDLSEEDKEAVASAPEEEESNPFNVFDIEEFMTITVHGDLWFYYVNTQNTYHTRNSAKFTEMTARLGADFTFSEAEWLEAQFRVVGTDVHGSPEDWTAPRRTDFGTRVDLANVSVSGKLGEWDSSLVVGLQELCYGDGLLVYDGITDKRAYWTTPLRSFPAVKWTVAPDETWSLDLFAAQVDDDHLSYEAYLGSYAAVEGGGNLYGADVNIPSEDYGTIDVAVFYKDEDKSRSRSGGLDTDSDTLALSLRNSLDIEDFNITGEIIKQWGKTRVSQNSLTPNSDRNDRDAWGGYLSARYNIPWEAVTPYIKARYAYFQGDDPSTSDVESFDPFYYGFYDWGYWFLGDMTSYSLTNTNEHVMSLEMGIHPSSQTKVRVFLYDFSLDEHTPIVGTTSWSQEVNIVFDYYPCDYAFLGAMVGAAKPGSAAETFNGGDNTQTEFMVWAGLYF